MYLCVYIYIYIYIKLNEISEAYIIEKLLGEQIKLKLTAEFIDSVSFSMRFRARMLNTDFRS